MNRLPVLFSVVLVGCASSGTPSSGPAPLETIRISGGAGLPTSAVNTRPTEESAVTTVRYPADRVWAALRAAYDSLAIPPASVDQASRTISNGSIRVRRRLGDVLLSKYINCGNTQGGNGADTYEVVLSVTTRADPVDAGTTRVTTLIDAMGRPITLSGEYARCRTTGFLEKRITEIVTAQLSR